MIGLGLDLSKAQTGWAVDGVRAPCPPRAGNWNGPDLALGYVLDRYAKWLCEFIRINQVGAVAYEAAIQGGEDPKFRNAQTAELLICFGGVTAMVCAGMGVPSHKVSVSTARKNFLGQGYPPNPKRAVSDRCKLLGWPTPNYDATDALCVWAWLKMTKDPSFRLETATPLFGRPKVQA